MTLTAEQPSTATTGATPTGWLRRHRGKILVALAAVLATTFVVLSRDGTQHDAALDPQNPQDGGARAVARVLADQGIDVDVVRDADAFGRATIDADTTVLVTSPENLGRGTVRQLLDRAEPATLVVVDPPPSIAGLLGTDGGITYGRTKRLEASCADPTFTGLRMEARSGTAFPSTGGSCFPVDDGTALLTRPAPASYFLGAADLLANNQITSADNAAIALRLLGGHDRLVWYVPDRNDQSSEDGVSVGSLLPRWLGPALALLCVSVAGLVYWRGRRFGALAVEPLPVTVTAIETTRSRGRLYRKANDRGYAAEALRRDARTRLSAHLLLPRASTDDVDVLVAAVAPYSTLDPLRLRELLGPGSAPPGNDKDLIALANDLAALIREVRRP